MKKVPLSLIVLMLVLCCFLSCSLPLAEAPKEIEDNKEEVTEPVPPLEEQKKEFLLPVSLDEVRSGSMGSRHVLAGNPYNDDGTLNEKYIVASPAVASVAFAGFGEREVSEDMTYDMVIQGTTFHCTLTEDPEVYIIEGKSEEDDSYIYMTQKKDRSELSVLEIAKFYWPNAESPDESVSIIVRYAPSVTMEDGRYDGHFFSYEIGKQEEQWLIITVDEYIHLDDDFIGYAIVDGLRDSKETPFEENLDLLEMSLDNAKYVYAHFTDPADLGKDNAYSGAFMYFQKQNDYRFQSVGSIVSGRSLQEISEQAKGLSPNWNIDFSE